MSNGLPYNPRSQGAVKRIHNTIRNGLLAIFLENTNEFNLEKALIKYMNIYNKSDIKLQNLVLMKFFIKMMKIFINIFMIKF